MSGRYHDDLFDDDYHPVETEEELAWFAAQDLADRQYEAEHGRMTMEELRRARRERHYPDEHDPSFPSEVERDWNPESSY